jgi:hypothetical protein
LLRTERSHERRRAVRRAPEVDEPLSQIRLRAGRQLSVLDISDSGLLAEGEMRLLPGTHVEVHLVTCDGRLLVRSRVVRAFVCHVGASEIRYRGALAFDRPVPSGLVGYAIPVGLDTLAAAPGNPYPDAATSLLAAAANSSLG